MQRIWMLLALICLVLAPLNVHAQQRGNATPASTGGWSVPTPLGDAGWPSYLRYFSLSDDATRLVAVNPYSGGDDNSRHILVSESVAGAWQTPVVIAQNGVYSDAPMQWLPQRTHPIISGDGNTIVYVGYTGMTFGAYVVDRLPGGGWSAPALIPTGLSNTHYWISLSQDGTMLALGSYALFDVDHVYVLTRTAGVWSAPVRVSAESGPLQGGGMPSLSADGTKLVYVQNARVVFVEQIGGQWSAPQQVTANNYWEGEQVGFPQISGDGRAVVYWLVRSAGSVLTDQDLYVMRRTGGGWSAPQKATATPTLPITEVSSEPAAMNRQATRLLYSRPITTTDPVLGSYVYASHLEIAEWRDGAWHEARLVDAQGVYQHWPRLTPNGMTLIFAGGSQIWQMTTDAPPAPLPLPTSTSAQIGPAGGVLFSEIDQTRYEFAPETFTETVHFTHTVWADLPARPAGQISIGGIGGLGRGFAATALSSANGLPLQPTRPVTVAIDYGATGTGAAIPGTLCLWWMDVNGWVRLPGVDDPLLGKLTSRVEHFSYFAVFGETNSLFLPLVMR
jgi:hypothetical protein